MLSLLFEKKDVSYKLFSEIPIYCSAMESIEDSDKRSFMQQECELIY